MENLLTSKKIIWLFLIIGLLAVLVTLAVVLTQKQRTTFKEQVSATPGKEKIDVAVTQLPDKFPANFPQEAGAQITANHVQTTADGRFQSTRTYITTKTLAENVKIFRDYFAANGWRITATVDQSNYQVLSAAKDNLTMQVSMNDNKTTQKKTVNVFVVEQPNPAK